MQTPKVACAALNGWLRPGNVPPAESLTGSMPLADFVGYAEQVASDSGDELLGWTLGTQYPLAQMGPISEALQTTHTLGAALQVLVDYFSLVQDASELTLTEEDGGACLAYRILDPDIWPRHQDAIFTLGIVAQLVRRAAGCSWDKVQLGIECGDAERAARLALRAGVSCAAGADRNWLRIPAGFALLPMPWKGAGDCERLRKLDRLLVRKRRELTAEARVRTLIYRQLGDRDISQEQIARHLGMSSRTLRRHLAAAATSFQQLVDDCRLRQAAHEFRVRRNVSIAQTALRLGYSEHSTFTRAFSRWSGMPPQSFIRAQLCA